jgi:putative modified peptide
MITTLSSDIDLLLHKLENDDTFRARLLRDPVGALDSIGIDLDPEDIPASIRLPSKETIARDRMDILDKLDNAAGAIPFFLSGK